GNDAVDDHRTGHGEHSGGHAGDKALAAEIDGGGSHGVGKAGNGHQGPRPAVAGQLVVEVQPCQQHRQQDQGGRCGGGGVLAGKAQGQPPLLDQLAQYADSATDKKGKGAVLGDGRGLLPLFDQL